MANYLASVWGTPACRYDSMTDCMCTYTHLLSEPFVELFIRVKHESISLGALLALGHQGRELITLKQTRYLCTCESAHVRKSLSTNPVDGSLTEDYYITPEMTGVYTSPIKDV